jgi:hypothetical protein
VEDGEIGARRIIVRVGFPRPQRVLDAAEQGLVRVGLEVGIDQVRDLPRMPVQVDQVRPLDLAQVKPIGKPSTRRTPSASTTEAYTTRRS